MLALTGGAPKELVEVGGIPVLERVMAECAASGIEEILIVVAPGKQAVGDFARRRAGGAGMPAHVAITEQPVPRGLADAIRLGRPFANGQPLAVALPDNLFLTDAPAVGQVIETHSRTNLNVVGVVEISAGDAAHVGPTAVYPGRVDGNDFHIERVPDKGERTSRFDTGGAAAAFTGIGRFVFMSDGFDAIDEVDQTLAPGKELDDVQTMQLLLERKRLIGCRIRGRFLDVGLPDGYAEANALLGASSKSL
jgi:UTP--glucose-1-phosphate uridylyltransferase